MPEPVRATAEGSFRTAVEIGPHRLIADEPASAGGNDAGPTPYDLLAAALASCTAMTLHYFASREKIPLRGVEVTVTQERKHSKDCEDCLSDEGYVHSFNVAISLKGELSEPQHQKLLEIAGRCPVAKTLQNEIKIYEKLKS